MADDAHAVMNHGPFNNTYIYMYIYIHMYFVFFFGSCVDFQVKDYIYQQMKFSALLRRSWAMWVLAMAPLLGFVWAIAMLDVRSQRSFMRLWRSCNRWEKPWV